MSARRCLPGHELPEQTGSSETNFPEHSRKATGAPKRTSRKQKLSSRKKLLLRNTMKNAKIAIFPELPKIFPEAKTIFPEAAKYLPGSKTAIFPEAKTIFRKQNRHLFLMVVGRDETLNKNQMVVTKPFCFKWPRRDLKILKFRHGHWKGHLEDARKALKLGTGDPSPPTSPLDHPTQEILKPPYL